MKNPFLTPMTEQYLRIEGFSDEEAEYAAHAINQHEKLVKAGIDVLPYLPKDIIGKNKPRHVVVAMAFREALQDAMKEKP